MAVLEWLAKSYYRLGQIGKAIEILEKRVLPLNNNLKEDTRGWNVVYDKFFLPNFLLATYYLKEGKTDLAIANYQEAKKIAAVSAGFSELASWQIQQTFDPLDKAIAPFLPKTKK